ncbi:hypothetical protein P691DRAFT_215037 [Macrolepiota fuliginosa MF-IS2]|uniref:Uncharacterized protein n=1 Tax=Macrolepiota fuliginosa MF-IS2 TaxID=1400762 RepID=A0A9P5X830_9AGAR|nr:hypothetical protein P691DRAFT_215037 [Macrolepiota fuliginosa MF-IS2]
MTTPNTYDEGLLASAPEVTKADLQDGYNPDLLREPTVGRKNTTRATSTPPRSNSDPHLQHYPLPNKDIESLATPLQPKEAPYEKPRKPLWRTKKAVILAAIIAILIILAAVLGGVLGSRKKGTTDVKNNSGSGQSPGQGVGSASPPVVSSSPLVSSSQTQAQSSPTTSGVAQPVASGSAGVSQGTSGSGNGNGNGGGSNIITDPSGTPSSGDSAPPSGGLGVPSSQPGAGARDVSPE